VEHQIKCIEIDPNYSRAGRRFVIGNTSLILYEKALLGRMKPTTLCESEGCVGAIKWSGHFIAWSSSIGVRVYDIYNRCSIGLVKWDEPSGSKLADLRCCLVWNKSTLYVGWAETIRTFAVTKRSLLESSTNSHLPTFTLDPMSVFTTDFFICGLAPTENDHLVILGMARMEDEEEKNQRPILSVVKLRGDVYEELCNDSLTLRE
jgi:vacuolar protein sorting-associated protein 41